MQTGLILALCGATSWAINSVLVRKLTSRTGESFSSTITSIYIGIPFFAVLLTVSGEWGLLAQVPAHAFIFLAVAGVVQLIIGRWLNYYAFQQIGANKAVPLTSTAPLYAVTFAVIFLDESLTAYLIIGVLSIMLGVILITGEKGMTAVKTPSTSKSVNLKGAAAALAAGLCYGASSVMLKAVINDIGSPFTAGFIYFVVATFFVSFLFINPQRRREFSGIRNNAVLLALLTIGFVGGLNQLFIYLGLKYAPASRVMPLYSTSVLLVFFISYLFNRKQEVFTVKIFLGMIAVVAGAFFVFQ